MYSKRAVMCGGSWVSTGGRRLKGNGIAVFMRFILERRVELYTPT
jgi:hypothetical protein